MIERLVNGKNNKLQDILVEIIAWIAAIMFFSILGYAFYNLFIR